MKLNSALQILIPSLLLSVSQAAVIVVPNVNAPAYTDASTAMRVYNVPDIGDVVTVTLRITFEKYDGEEFGVNEGGVPYYNEISFSLLSPGGTTVELIATGSFSEGADGFFGTITFDDAAAQAVNFDNNSPHAGTFRPTDPDGLADFAGESVTGAWTLTIGDSDINDHLGYFNSRLTITTPEPGSILLAGMASFGLLSRRRRETSGAL